MLPILLALGFVSFAGWLSVGLRPGRRWDMTPVAEDGLAPPEPSAWPPVRIVVPARNESVSLARTLPPLAAQDYPGNWTIVLVDDRSTDGTAELARRLGGTRTTVLEGDPLPEGWTGKVWALDQGTEGAAEPYLLFTDADILHAPGSLRRLVAESERDGLALNSRMARLSCESAAERLLIPPFVWFFNLLYPMRRVNDPGRAAAAGGCILLRRGLLKKAGGLSSIRGELIDDINLARRIAAVGGTLRLSLSRSDVRSLREYPSLGPIWTMVRRTAFTELGHSWIRVLGALLSMLLMLAVPPLLVGAGSVLAAGDLRYLGVAGLGLLSWAAMAALHAPAPRFFGLSGLRAWTLPLAGGLYALMTLDSALRGGRKDWR
ncbi:MAG TPA: glycosyltransferase [Planctomycetota bacterium]|nr:glycosyltransferase [Planctomycetota bacterium]